MTPEQRMARAHRAQAAYDEFVGQSIEQMIGTYTARMVEIANTELNPAKREQKLTALSNAIRITENIRAGLLEAIRDGDMAKADKLRAEKIEGMTAPQRRLFGVASY